MADNVAITQGTGTDIATDDIGSVHYQVVKLGVGAANAVDGHLDFGQAAMAASLPVALASDHSDVKVTLDGETVELGATALAALETITVATISAAIPAGDNNIGNVDIVTLPASTNTIEVVGDAAHDAAVAGNPLLVGLEGRSTDGTAITSGRVVRGLATLLGKTVTYPYALPGSTWSYASPAAVTDTNDDEAKAAVASTRHYISGVQVFNGHDTTATEVVIKDGSTVMWRGWAEQTGGGCSARFDPPLRGTANTAVNVANITNSSSTYFNLQGFSSAE